MIYALTFAAGLLTPFAVVFWFILLTEEADERAASAMSAFGQDRGTGLEAKPASAVAATSGETPDPHLTPSKESDNA